MPFQRVDVNKAGEFRGRFGKNYSGSEGCTKFCKAGNSTGLVDFDSATIATLDPRPPNMRKQATNLERLLSPKEVFMSPHPLDHLVMPVTDIRIARERLTALGFTVAADARHPFGTENACVFLRDKTYLEPLGIASQEESLATAKAGNQFTARNNAFRFRNGPEGLSAIVMGSQNADADDAAFRAEGLSAGEQLQFSRQMKLPDGSEITATFKLSFAADQRAPDFHAITCERINMPPADRSALEKHENGVKGIKTVILTEPNPVDFEDFVKKVVGQQHATATAAGVAIAASNAQINVLNADGLHDYPELKIGAGRGLHGAMVVFTVDDLTATETLLALNGITFNKHNTLLIVPHQPGQGVALAFSE
jgi:hypothetical protein